MGIKENLTEAVLENGRKYIYPLVIGTIKSIVSMPFGSADEKLMDINEALSLCDQIGLDASLPWEPQEKEKVSASTGSLKQNQSDSSMGSPKFEPLIAFPLIPLGPACEACPCYNCKYLGTCHLARPSTLYRCKNICLGNDLLSAVCSS